MSLADRWKEFSREFMRSGKAPTLESMRESFYAGAEAHAEETGHSVTAFHEIQAEIDRFKGQK